MSIQKEKGLTLVELMVVMVVIAVLAAIVVPSVMGAVGAGRGAGMTGDINQVGSGVDRFNADADKWPTLADIAATPAWNDGDLPPSGNYAGIDWDASAPAFGYGFKTFYPDYIKKKPRHWDETAADLTRRWRIDSIGGVSVEMDGTSY